jgi:hypothetical protein
MEQVYITRNKRYRVVKAGNIFKIQGAVWYENKIVNWAETMIGLNGDGTFTTLYRARLMARLCA